MTHGFFWGGSHDCEHAYYIHLCARLAVCARVVYRAVVTNTDTAGDPVRRRAAGLRYKIALSGTFGSAFIPIMWHSVKSPSLQVWLQVMETGRQASGANINVTPITAERSLQTNSRRVCASA